MTVGELLNQLRACPPDTPVLVGEVPEFSDDDMAFRPADKVMLSNVQKLDGDGEPYKAFCIYPIVPDFAMEIELPEFF